MHDGHSLPQLVVLFFPMKCKTMFLGDYHRVEQKMLQKQTIKYQDQFDSRMLQIQDCQIVFEHRIPIE